MLEGLKVSHRYSEEQHQLQPLTEHVQSTAQERRPLCIIWDDTLRLDLLNDRYVLINPKPCMLTNLKDPELE